FEISAAARFDDYSDFGSTANPKVGALWEPFDGLILRGSWGTSFNPPTLGVRSAGVAQLALVRVSDPSASDGLAPVGILLGVNPDVAPEEGETLTAGFDVRKEFGRHELTFTSTYYAITYDNLISRVPYPNNSLFNVRTAPQLVPAEIFYPNPSQEVVDGALAAAQASFGVLDLGGFLSPDGGLDASLLQYFYDYRNTNLAAARTRGLDFALRGSRETRKGEVSLGVSGNYIFELTRQGAETIPEVDLAGTVFNPVDFTLRGEAGWSHGPWRASAFANYRNAYIDNRSDPAVAIDSYTTVDMNVRCALGDFTGSRALDGLDISIGVINLFNEDPPFVASDIPAGGASTTANYDPANADPRGRFVHFEIAKRW
ncbi:MAG: TonB-dependent receptor, partial [Oricola sp.]|nr:TonB-dependent receptor [Oricola sp.]